MACKRSAVRSRLPPPSRSPQSPSSRGLGHRPFTAVTGVRIPWGGVPEHFACPVCANSANPDPAGQAIIWQLNCPQLQKQRIRSSRTAADSVRLTSQWLTLLETGLRGDTMSFSVLGARMVEALSMFEKYGAGAVLAAVYTLAQMLS